MQKNIFFMSVDLNGTAPSDSDSHLFNPMECGRSNDIPSPPANDSPAQQRHGNGEPRSAVTLHFSGPDRNSVYARVSKKLRLTDSPEEKQEGPEEAGPPLPDRNPEMDG